MRYLYLLVDFFTILIPLLFSFHPKIRFYRTWKQFFPALLLVAFIFVLWDALFASLHVWSFNPRYITGLYVSGLPVEEILFFICIPYSCVFTFYCLDKWFNLNWNDRLEKNVVIAVFAILVSIALVFGDRLYTSVTFIATAFTMVALKFVCRVPWLGRALSSYALLLIPFMIVNGILTGSGLQQPVVIYNPSEFMGVRLFTIPLEDVVYGLELFLLNIALYRYFLKNADRAPITRRAA